MKFNHVGEVIIALRRRRGITQAQLAEKIGICPTTINRIEKGVRPPSRYVLVKLSYFFGVDPEEVFENIDNKQGLELSIQTKADIILLGDSEEAASIRKELAMKSEQMKALSIEVDDLVSKLLKLI